MLSERFARELVRLGRLELPPGAALDRMTNLAAREVPGCAGMAVLVWQDGAAVQVATSDPDAGALLEFQLATHEGPHWETRRSGAPVLVTDTLTERRWPRYATLALRHGVRSGVAVSLPSEDVVVTVEFQAIRPAAFDGPAAVPLAVLLTEHLSVTFGNAERYEAAAREVSDMRRARDSSDVISEAKGMLMRAYGCDSETAFDQLRRMSQRSQLKLAEVARRLVRQHTAQDPEPSPDA